MIALEVAQQDELNNCLTDSITLADLLVDGSHENDPIAPYTVSHAGHIIGTQLRRVEELLSKGGAS